MADLLSSTPTDALRARLNGIRATFHVARDPDVAKGLGLLIEVARTIGKTL
jgi:uncharacterized protein YjgD (DUF1641 family)